MPLDDIQLGAKTGGIEILAQGDGPRLRPYFILLAILTDGAAPLLSSVGLRTAFSRWPVVLNWDNVTPATENHMLAKTQAARQALDAWTREMIEWHFNPETGCPFWLEYARKLDWDPRREMQTYDDLDRFGFFQDEWLRGGPVRRWVPKAYADRPIYVFETGGSTGVPKSRISIDDFRIDYEAFSDDTARRRISQGRGLAHGRPQRSAASAARGRAPGAASRRHLLHDATSTRAGSSS